MCLQNMSDSMFKETKMAHALKETRMRLALLTHHVSAEHERLRVHRDRDGTSPEGDPHAAAGL